MNEQQTTTTITLTGDLAEWLGQEADRNTRTPEQQATHLLGNFMAAANRRKQATIERNAKREAEGRGIARTNRRAA